MNDIFVTAVYGYFIVLYKCNQKLIKLCGADAISHMFESEELVLNIIDNIPNPILQYGKKSLYSEKLLNNLDLLLLSLLKLLSLTTKMLFIILRLILFNLFVINYRFTLVFVHTRMFYLNLFIISVFFNIQIKNDFNRSE